MRKLIERTEERSMWDEWGGKDPRFDHIMTVMGLNPNEDYSPRKKECPKCGKMSLVVVEKHPDTDMNCMAERCKECGYEKEL